MSIKRILSFPDAYGFVAALSYFMAARTSIVYVASNLAIMVHMKLENFFCTSFEIEYLISVKIVTF